MMKASASSGFERSFKVAELNGFFHFLMQAGFVNMDFALIQGFDDVLA